MALRVLVLAALISSAFSAHAQSTGTSQLQTYMPRAVEGFFVFTAPTAPVTAPVMLAGSGQSAPAPAAESAAQLAAAAAAEPAAQLAAAAAAEPAAQLAAALATEPAAQLAAAPAPQTTEPANASLVDFVSAGISTDVVAKSDIPSDAHAALTGGNTVNDALAPTVLLPLALEANALPEPSTSGLILAGLAGAGFIARRRRPR
jgi:hypothetical protein